MESMEQIAEVAKTQEESTDVESEVMHRVLALAKKLAKDKKGALFVILPKEIAQGTYECQYPQIVFGGSLLSKGMDVVLEKLASIDGAVFLTPKGDIIAYGARILKSSTFHGFGTRHAAAKGITDSNENVSVVLVSEESGWIKVFQKGNVALETDAIEVSPSTMKKLATYLTRHDTALLVSAGISAATLGLGAIGVIVVGGTYLVVKSAFATISSVLRPESK